MSVEHVPLVPAKWCARVVGTIHLPDGRTTTEATFGPFDTIREAGDWTERHRPEWHPVIQVQIMPLDAPY